MPPLRIVFFGTPEIAVPTLEALIAGPHSVVGVISQPDRRRGRGKKFSPSPVSEVALREKIELLRPEKVGAPEAVDALRALEPDLGIVVAFGQFLPKTVRELPSRGYLINAHASLLPKYRGASPIGQAILDREPETGVSVMRIEREMDAGPVALVRRIPIEARENTAELTARLAAVAAEAIAEAVDLIAGDSIEWTEQDVSLVSVAPKIEKSDSVLCLGETAADLAARIHALSPKPGGSVEVVAGAAGTGEPETLKISRADTASFAGGRTPEPGTIDLESADAPLRIATGDGWLVPLVVQRAGGKALAVADFLRGYSIPDGARCTVISRDALTNDDRGAAGTETQTEKKS